MTENTEKENSYDVAIVGAGPAGLMAAGRAAELGAKVILLEKNKKPGKKLLLSGKGRCNITNAEFNLRALVENYGPSGKFLFRAFSNFDPKEVIEFFSKLGLKTKIERGKRVFPISDKAGDVLNTLIKYLSKNKVEVACDAEVIGIDCQNNRIIKLILKNREIKAKKYIICTGGKSYPATGSTGDGFGWAQSLGHTVSELLPVLTPIRIKESWVKELQGLSLKNVEVSVFQQGKKQGSRFGECLFTHYGLSGPIILSISKEVGQLLKEDEVKLSLDLKPALELAKLDERIQRDFRKYQNKLFKNSLADLLPSKLIPIVIRLSNIDPEIMVNKVTSEERHALVKLLKNLEMTAEKLLGFSSAIVTSGGISLKEIDDKTMKSKIIENLFFAGEVIDIDGPTGGFNLQVCWSTGYLAAEHASKN